jgi:hypothetical protein
MDLLKHTVDGKRISHAYYTREKAHHSQLTQMINQDSKHNDSQGPDRNYTKKNYFINT